jgi:tRNA (adenine57-N1/adenine58-N1)-methyltransferase
LFALFLLSLYICIKDLFQKVRFLDLERGDHVLEAGTGNGSLTLYLARCVAGTTGNSGLHQAQHGKVDTFDIRESHIRQAEQTVGNFARGIYRETVKFHYGSPSSILANGLDSLYDGAVLDMPEPRHELEMVVKWLKNDRFLVCYLPNVTQVVDLLSFIRKNNLPLAMDDCVDVIIQEWEVRPTIIRKAQSEDTTQENQDSVWICRPKNFDVKGHTAYLIKLRKCHNIV